MKTAISVDDSLLEQADKAARRLGLSRSRLFAVAVSQFLERQKQEQMLAQLNAVYADGSAHDEKPLLNHMKAKVRRTLRESR